MKEKPKKYPKNFRPPLRGGRLVFIATLRVAIKTGPSPPLRDGVLLFQNVSTLRGGFLLFPKKYRRFAAGSCYFQVS